MAAFRFLTLELKFLAVKLEFLPAALIFLAAVLFLLPPSLIFPAALLPPFFHEFPVTAFRVGFRLLLFPTAGPVVEVAGQQLRHPYDGEHYGGVGAGLHIH